MRHTAKSLRRRATNILKHEKIRFGLVGVINTAVDFGILAMLAVLTSAPVLLANVISTSCALMVSYVLNKKAVFGDQSSDNTRQVLQFLVITLSGLWLVQTAVISLVMWIISTLSSSFDPVTALLIGKIFATGASLVWNYLWYSKVVFTKESK